MNDNDLLKGKFSNIFIKLLVGIMSNDLKDVKHFLSDDLYKKYQNIVNENLSNNEVHCYDELNVKDLSIDKIETDDKYEIVYVSLTSRYMDYYIDSESLNYKRGTNDHRIEEDHELIFKKLLIVGDRPAVIKCPGCGANLDANNTGYCKYCGTVHSAESYDYILYEVTNL